MVGIPIEMPNNCCDCPVNDHDAWCGITLTEFGDDYCKIRLPDCPLIDLTDDGKQSTMSQLFMQDSELFGISEQLKDS